MASIDLNFFATITVAIIAYIIGALWYSPILFSKPWMKALGIKSKDLKKQDSKIKDYITQFIITLVMAFVLSIFVDFAIANTFFEGVFVGFLSWLGFVATTILGSMIWIKKPMTLFYIDAGHYLVTYCIMAGILAIWL